MQVNANKMRNLLYLVAAIVGVMVIMAAQPSSGSTGIGFSRVKVLHLNSVIPSLTFSPDGKELLVVGVGKSVTSFLDDGIEMQEARKLFKHSPKLILFFSTSTWNRTGELKFTRTYPYGVNFWPGGKISANLGGDIEFFDAKTRKRVFVNKQDQKLLNDINRGVMPFSRDGRFFAAGSASNDDFYLDLYEITNRGIKLVRRRQRPRWTEWGYPRALGMDFSPDGRFLAVGGSDGTLELWDVKAWKLLRRYQDAATRADSGWAWNPKTFWLSRVAGPALAHVGWVGAVEFSPDGKLLASVDVRHESSVKIWEVRTGRLVHSWLLSKDPIDQTQGLDFSPDGTLLAACSIKRVAVFDVASGKELWSEGKDVGFEYVTFSPTQPIFAFVNYPNRGDKVDIEIWRYGSSRELPSQ